jgi:subtilisin
MSLKWASVLLGVAVIVVLGFYFALLSPTTEARATSVSGQERAGDVRPDRYIVVLRDGVPSARAVADEHARDAGARVSHVYEHALKGYAAYIPAARLDRVKNDRRVDFVEQDYVQEAFAQTLPTGVNRIEGDKSTTANIDTQDQRVDVDIAVLDTGIDTHTDLNVAGGYNCTSSDRGNYGDGHGHGTHVAGTAAALDNTSGVVGAAPGARLWAMKVLNDSGSGFTSWIICGIDRVTKHNTEAGLEDIEVANMSLGGSGGDSECSSTSSDSYHKAICDSTTAGVTYVVAAGNGRKDLKNFRPATYDEVLTVTAAADFNGQPGGGAAATCRSDVDDTAANFSNFTTIGHPDEGHTIAAPGVCIRSTWEGGGYRTISGTSMASPHVAGAAALYKANNPTATPAQVMAKLRDDAKVRSGNNPDVADYYGYTDDPNTPKRTRYYGYLAYAGGY